MNLRAVLTSQSFRGWALLAFIQAGISLVLFHDFLFGDKFFAFKDVGSDTFTQFVPNLMYLASPEGWASAWSFNVGLGNVVPLYPSPFTLLAIAGGAERVLDMRIWVYLAKIFVGGGAFFGFALAMGTRLEIARIVAVAYSFCGFIATDGQWDPLATEFAAYPLILWSIARHASRPNAWLIPLCIAFAACIGVFMFSAGVFVAYAFVAACVASDRPVETARKWVVTILPQCALGVAIAAPVVLPTVIQLLDSPRVGGAQVALAGRLGELFAPNDSIMLLIELAGFFHKNVLGIGNRHFGWMNYLESPGFYVGMLPLLLIPQLWKGSPADKRILRAAGIALGLFIFIPAFRQAAFGFGIDYFRVNNLWVSLLMLTLFAKALEVVARRGVDGHLVGVTAATLALVAATIQTGLLPQPSTPHKVRIAALALAALVLLFLLARKKIDWPRFSAAALLLVAVDCAVVNYPSFHAPQRDVVTRSTPGFHSPGTDAALAFIKARDPGFHRIEKTFDSVSFCDALVQNYMGVKSYAFHGAGIVGLFSDLALLPSRNQLKNYTNWLPTFGERFALNTLTGVKYLIADRPVSWPGFRRIADTHGLSIYENEVALPLGVVYEKQYPRSRLDQLSPQARDITLINAAIVDRPPGNPAQAYDARSLADQGPDWLERNYFSPARQLRKRGLSVESMTPGQVVGSIVSDVPGILVLSIPFARGWTISIDGENRPVYKANLGLLATDIAAGTHRVELRYALPGFTTGLALGALALLAMLLLAARTRRAPA